MSSNIIRTTYPDALLLRSENTYIKGVELRKTIRNICNNITCEVSADTLGLSFYKEKIDIVPIIGVSEEYESDSTFSIIIHNNAVFKIKPDEKTARFSLFDLIEYTAIVRMFSIDNCSYIYTTNGKKKICRPSLEEKIHEVNISDIQYWMEFFVSELVKNTISKGLFIYDIGFSQIGDDNYKFKIIDIGKGGRIINPSLEGKTYIEQAVGKFLEHTRRLLMFDIHSLHYILYSMKIKKTKNSYELAKLIGDLSIILDKIIEKQKRDLEIDYSLKLPNKIEQYIVKT